MLGALGSRLLHAEAERGVDTPVDPSSKRAAKIERFKQDKLIAVALQAIEERRRAGRGGQEQVRSSCLYGHAWGAHGASCVEGAHGEGRMRAVLAHGVLQIINAVQVHGVT